MAKDKYFLDLYKKIAQDGKLLLPGLCNIITEKENIFELFDPYVSEREELNKEGHSTVFWGSGMARGSYSDTIAYTFTPLRQTILLFCAALNNEL